MSSPVPAIDGERADSRRKRLRLIDAARAVVAEKGMDAAAAEIAARAEVGVGTLYRRFGSKEALIKDILLDGIAEMRTAAEDSLANPDPWDGLATFFAAFSAAQLANRGLAEFTADHASAFAQDVAEHSLNLRAQIAQLTERAHQAGVLRDDVSWRDLVVLSLASVQAGECLGVRATEQQSKRTSAILLQGLRAPGTDRLPGEPPIDLVHPAHGRVSLTGDGQPT
ncbi:MAG TPA: TetR/AcrR family transcriptional regulator [Pseudonocardia sp.]|uniref:TetR/AcrR family transcriptional regulator n=1 Tax=Pseudonocardia sp. TaxID=60912 RepID=UPI002B75FBBA|nr:TetR/AcrR family transcriptional regulator [Pseudonocardia sp.]HTF50654.1 TetR/AcrR family transcriptional regulator [Pseudonocardia sp.]